MRKNKSITLSELSVRPCSGIRTATRTFGSGLLISAVLVLAACDSSPSMNGNNSSHDAAPTNGEKPQPNYGSKEGDKYLYISAVSEDDQKAGRSTGSVVFFRYLGKIGEEFQLEDTDADGTHGSINSCTNPCKIIKVTDRTSGKSDRIAYSSTSIIGSAFSDAFNGYLVAATKSK